MYNLCFKYEKYNIVRHYSNVLMHKRIKYTMNVKIEFKKNGI